MLATVLLVRKGSEESLETLSLRSEAITREQHPYDYAKGDEVKFELAGSHHAQNDKKSTWPCLFLRSI